MTNIFVYHNKYIYCYNSKERKVKAVKIEEIPFYVVAEEDCPAEP